MLKYNEWSIVRIIFAVIMFIAGNELYADDVITLYNHTDVPVYAALYYVKSNLIGVSIGPAERRDDVFEVRPYNAKKLIRPPWKFITDNREIIFSTRKDALKVNLTKKEYKVSSNKSAGQKYGSVYHIIKANGIVTVYGDVQWKLLQPLNASIKIIAGRVFHENTDFFKQHKYVHTEATVRQSKDLSTDEINYITNRSVKVKAALESILKESLTGNIVPRIGICMSGGGVRAATCSYGFIAGLNEIGLLDAVTYAAALSGSTWMLISYLQVGKTVSAYREELLQAVAQEHLLDPAAITDTFLQKYVYNQSLSIVDLYGVYLANKFFRNIHTDLGRQRVWFSELRDRIRDGSFMFPLCTAVEISQSKHKPIWYTFSPYEIGSDELGLYVPTWGFGRQFFEGVSTNSNNPPELRLGFFMGLWGSALSSTFKHMYDLKLKKIIDNPIVRFAVEGTLKETIGPLQFAPINIMNPFYGMNQTAYNDLEQLTFVDAGVAYNLPLVPLLNKRSVDIIIVLDASESVHEGASQLRKAEKHMHELGIPFPPINYTNITKKAVTVFSDSDPNIPIVMYVVPVKNAHHPELGDPEKEFTSTYKTANFSYSKRDAERLIDIVRYNVIDNKEIIVNAIKKKINQKNNAKAQAR